MKKIKVSIITVCLNSVKTLEQTIQSVINQTYKNIEYIIIDGGSTDRTLDIISKYEDRITTWISEKDNGLYDAMNKGIAMATGDIVGIINSDDWYELNAVEKVVKAFEEEKTEVVYGVMEMVYQNGYTSRVKNGSLEQMLYRMVVPHPTAFVKRGVYQKIGVFDLKYKIVADYDLFLRIYLEGLKMKQVDAVLAYFRDGGVSTANAIECANEVRRVARYYAEKRNDENCLERIEQNYQIRLAYAKTKEIVRKIQQHYIRDAEIKIKEWMLDKGQIKIFGAGSIGVECFLFLNTLNVSAESFLDNHKVGEFFLGLPVKKCVEKSREKSYILVAVMNYQEEIIRQLEKLGYQYRKDFCTYYDLVEGICKEVSSQSYNI